MPRLAPRRTLPLRHSRRMAVAPDEARDSQEGPQPPDGGWGWVVAAGVFIIALVVPMLSPSFGILFSRQLVEWRASSTSVAVIFNTFLVVWRLAGVVMGTLTREFGFRRVALTGTLLTSISLTLSAFVTSPAHLLVTFSLGCGLGNGLSCVGYLILAHYFKRRRGLANSCLMAGAGLGHFASPLVIRLLQEEYGVRGAIMILGGITFHAVLGASAFQPVEWHWKKPEPKSTMEDREVLSCLLPVHTRIGVPKGVEPETQGDDTDKENPTNLESSASRPVSQSSRCADTDDLPPSVSTVVTLTKSELSAGPPSAWGNVSHLGALWRRAARVLRSVASDMTTLRRPTCLIIALGSTLVINAEANFLVMVPFAIQAAGYSLQTAAWCVSIAGVCNFFTRMCVSALSDLPWFNMRLCYMAGMAVMATSVLVFTLQMESVWQAGVMGMWGCAAGVFYGLNNLLMTRIVGLQSLTSVYGARNLLGALGFFSLGPMVGVIRDVSGSYACSIWVLAGFITLSFLLWLLMPAAQAYERRQARPGSEE